MITRFFTEDYRKWFGASELSHGDDPIEQFQFEMGLSLKKNRKNDVKADIESSHLMFFMYRKPCCLYERQYQSNNYPKSHYIYRRKSEGASARYRRVCS